MPQPSESVLAHLVTSVAIRAGAGPHWGHGEVWSGQEQGETGGWWSNSVSGSPPDWDTIEKLLYLSLCRLVLARTGNFTVTLSPVRVYIMARNE
jgi:hypothetical protein